MKVFATAALVAAASAAAPTIELNLEGMTSAFKLKTSIYRAHDLKYAQPDKTSVASRQDWTEKCAAKTTCGAVGSASYNACKAACPFPVARAYDHQDGTSVTVKTRIFLVDEEGKTKNMMVSPNKFSFAKRSTFLFKYDAKDQAGNRAEQVVFALILDDQTAPTINVCNGVAETVEAASGWKLCPGSVAMDNIDGNVKSRMTYSIQDVTNAGASNYMCQGASFATAVTKITTNKVGKFLVTYTVSDKAGVYGRNSANNVATARKAVLVKDTRAPWINVAGAEPTYYQCNRYHVANKNTYQDLGATVSDLLDTKALGKTIKAVVNSGGMDSSKVADYTYTYNAQDNAGNKAKQQTRVVKVRDTLKPTVTLNGVTKFVYKHTTGVNSRTTMPDMGARVTDECEPAFAMKAPLFQVHPHTCKGIKADTASCAVTWSRPFSMKKLGCYVRTYTAQDSANNKQYAIRTQCVVDEQVPTIKIMGAGAETYEASRDIEYTDKGATCADYVDGVLSHAVEVSGQVVNMRIPGTYKIRYDCQDLSGNQAQYQTRTVVIRDTTCPKVTLKGANINYVEAGFPYVDAGATATDSLDGDITALITTDGDTVDTANAFYSRRTCRDIKLAAAKAKQAVKCGNYYITTFNAARSAYQRTQVCCDMPNDATYMFVTATSKPIRTFGADNKVVQAQASKCSEKGMQIYNYYGKTSTKAFKAVTTHIKTTVGARLSAYGLHLTAAKQLSDSYVCTTAQEKTTEAEAQLLAQSNHNSKAGAIRNAEVGKYVIAFHVQDKAKNKECVTKFRTVVVKDTLAPVITLHLKNKLIHQSASADKGIGGQANPAGVLSHTNAAGVKVGNPYLKDGKFMAEESASASTNGWVLGAAASAVTGLALLGFSQRKSTVTTVPV